MAHAVHAGLAQSEDAAGVNPQVQDVGPLGAREPLAGELERALAIAEHKRGLGRGPAPGAIPRWEAVGARARSTHRTRRA
jgi:hypothetical protein